MAKASQGELSRLRKMVSAYVKGLIGLGIAAQTLSSSGGSYLAISRLISSGISIASQLQRGIVVRVVGAPLVRRRPRGRARASPAEEYPEPSAPSAFGAEAPDQEATGWEEVVPASLSLAEIESQPFSLAKALPSIVAAQKSAFRALSSVNAAVARVVGGTAFGSSPSRSSPSETSMEASQRTSPDSFPEGQATTFAGEMPALAVSAAFMGAASSMAFNLSSAAHETTNIALGSQAMGAGFSSQQPRPAREGTAFAPSSQPSTSPSLLQQSITGVVDTSLVSPPQAGANLGLASSAGGASSSSSVGATSPSSDLSVTREASAPASLSAEVGGPSSSGARPSATSSSSPAPGSGAGLNAGPYTVPNGFNSVLSTPAFAAASQLSMQVRSLGASGPSGQLPVRASQEPSTEVGRSLGMALVPDQYPSSYPAGAAYSLSGIVASLGLGQSTRAAASSAETGHALTVEEARGSWDASAAAGEAQVGGPLGVGGPGIHESPPSQAEGEPGREPWEELSSSPQVFGERWTGSLAAAAGIGGALMGMLTLSSASPPSGAWLAGVAASGSRGAQTQASSYSRAVSISGTEAEERLASGRDALGAEPFPSSTAPSRNQAVAPAEATRGTAWGELRQPGSALPASTDLSLAASEREPESFGASAARAGVSVWEIATLLPGILTPAFGSRASVEAGRPLGGSFFIHPMEPSGAKSGEALATQAASRDGLDALQRLQPPVDKVDQTVPPAPSDIQTAFETAIEASGEMGLPSASNLPTRSADAVGTRFERAPAGQASSRAGLDALQLAASLRAVVLSASAATMGARAAGLSPSAAGVAPARGEAPELGYLPPGARGTFVSQDASGLARRVDSFGLSRGVPGQAAFQDAPRPASFAATRLAALQATFASRSLSASPAVGVGSSSASFVADAVSAERSISAQRHLVERSTRPASGPSPALSAPRREPPSGASTQSTGSTSAPKPLDGSTAPVYERELDAALSSLSREGRTSAEGVFFGLAAVSQALSLAAKLPSAAQLNGPLATIPWTTGVRQAGAQPARQTVNALAEPSLAAEASPRLTESWRSAPEEALTRMLEEQSGKATATSQETPQEADDRELRRKIEKMLDEELRRHGYQT